MTWFPIDQLPEVGSKFIATYSDGSGAAMFFRHDEGFIDSDGDDFATLGDQFGEWTYLPRGFELWCENWAEDPMTLPFWEGRP